MANNKIKFKYGICQNSHVEETGKPCPLCQSKEVQRVIATKEFICSECKAKLKEIPRPPTFWEKYGTIITIAAAVIVLAGIGFGVYNIFKPKGITGITLDKKELVMKVGETQVIVPTAEPKGVKATFTFKSQSKNISVNSGGEVTALKKGEASVRVKCEENPNIGITCKIKIEDGEVPNGGKEDPTVYVKQLSIDGDDFELKVGESKQLSKTVVPEKHDEIISWVSDNEAVASVDNAGNVKAVKEGTANIKIVADKSGVNASVKVTVKKPNGPKPPVDSSLNLGYAIFKGDSENNKPNGSGIMTYKQHHQAGRDFNTGETVYAEPGEYVDGVWGNGYLQAGTLFKKNGNAIKIKY